MAAKQQNEKIYQVKPGYVHRKVAGADVLISVGGNVANFNGYIELNEAASHLWDWLKEPCTCAQLAEKLAGTFAVSVPQAEEDVRAFLDELLAHDMAEMR